MAARDLIHEPVCKALENVYLTFLRRVDPERALYIAVSDVAYTLFMKSGAIQMLLSDNHVPLIVVNPVTKEVVAWVQH